MATTCTTKPILRTSYRYNNNHQSFDSLSGNASTFNKMKPSATGTTATTNPVEQLQLLRGFVSDVDPQHNGSGSAYSETELLECLKYSGYNVERAAELLMTGQYKSIMKPRRTTVPTNSGRRPIKKSVFFRSTTSSSSPIKTKKNKNDSAIAATTGTQKSTSTKKPTPAPPRVSLTPTATIPRQNIPAKKQSNHHNNIDRDLIWIMDDDHDAVEANTVGFHHKNHPSTDTSSSVTKMAKHETSRNDNCGPFLLCQRWISNATITSRGTRTATPAVIRYREPFQMDYTQTGYSIIKFRTAASSTHAGVVEGRLPEHISRILIPFLRYPQQPGTLLSSPIITVQIESMMEETNIVVGSTVPVQITIYIQDTHEFFRIISSASAADGHSSSKHYFQRQSQHNANFDHLDRSNTKKNYQNHSKYHTLPLNEAAFLLFQWAQYGDVPIFDDDLQRQTELTNFKKKKNNNNNNTLTDRCAKTKKKYPNDGVQIEDCDQEDDENTDDDDKDLPEIDDEEIDNEDLESTEVDGNSNVEIASSSWTDALPDDIPDPLFFQQNDISLRPYQKQALYFMIQRETVGMTREQLDDQLQLLNELSQDAPDETNRIRRPHAPWTTTATGSSLEMTCDCGPVRLTEDGRLKSRTLDGDMNPIVHPLWQHRYLASPDMRQSITVFVSELFGIVTHVPPRTPQHCSGGILADAMGLGKTVMLLALILKSKEEQQQLPARSISSPPTATATLVIAKLSLLPQWESELKTKTNLTYRIYYGSNSGKPTNTTDFLKDVDVVVTTYGTIQSELRQSCKYPVLLACDWLRVILDEAHCIRNHRTLASKACCQLKTQHRWCVTGTIIQNSLDDVYGIMKFLQHEPWCSSSFWNTAITRNSNMNSTDQAASDPAFREKTLKTAIDRIRRILGPILIRRTKDSLTKDGQPILTLPPIELKMVQVTLSDSEREFYNAVLARSLEVFDGFIKDGTAAKAYFQIFSLLSRLRQSCDHIALTVKSKIDDDEWMSSTNMIDREGDLKLDAQAAKSSAKSTDTINNQFLNNLLKKFYDQQETVQGTDSKRICCDGPETSSKRMKTPAYISSIAKNLTQAMEDNATHMDDECPICLDCPKIEAAVLTPCGHIFCRDCLIGAIRSQSPTIDKNKKPNDGSNGVDSICPTCQEKFHSTKIMGLSDSLGDVDKDGFSHKQSQREHGVRESPVVMARQILSNAVSGTESSKMKAILDELNEIWKLEPGSKVLMFSHYLGFLDLLGARFKTSGIPYFRLDGSLNVRERMHVLDEFRTSVTSKQSTVGTVLLMSMSAGAEGLNIVSASSCFILEPWWNRAKEDQCQNRIHRFGQNASLVRVRKFIVRDSVEERIVELQQRKAYVAGEIYNDAGQNTTKKECMESAKLSLEDFRLIFR